ncbi:hypothetical protein QBC42DRAFT_289823 [Cladorrhinum samala]|uniref:Uncharacterized protein n=1 Tax=Cladorrhinum samala TaxID=585594 RepID=A0AAV9HIB8_9PEZI|nr:hypothetical protein QBC42DRAFT_289823 [Cladorrhinum samala]
MAYFASLICYITLLFASWSWGYDLSERKAPVGRFKLALDYGLARENFQAVNPDLPNPKPSEANVLLSTHITFSRPVNELFTDEQLWQISRDAVDEVEGEVRQYGFKKALIPRATTIMAWGNETIIATSQKGQSFTYDSTKQTPVLSDLRLCEATIANSDPRHRTSGSCGEEMVAHIYYLLYLKGPHIRDLYPRARIGTWINLGGGTVPRQADPCGTNDDLQPPLWGCSRFVGDTAGGQNFDVLDRDLERAPYRWPLVDTVVGIDQMQLCGSIFIHP